MRGRRGERNRGARRDIVSVMLMTFLVLVDSQNRRVRLVLSALSPEQIRTSVTGLGRYAARRLGRERPRLGLAEG